MIKGIIFDFNRTVYDPDNNCLTEGVLNLLERLKDEGYKLCLLSKKTREDRKEQISELGLDKYFIDIQVTEEAKTKENFERCLKAMSLYPLEVVVIGDRIKSEIFLGNKMNMTTIWYKSGKFASETPQNKGEEPTYTITKLEEILRYLK